MAQPPLPPPPSSRKEWRAVSENSYRSNGSEDAEHGNLGQSDERTVYEEGRDQLEVDFCSINIDGSGGLTDDILQQRLQSVARQRVELQQVEIELRAQTIAHPQILEAQNSFQAQMNEQAAATAKLKEQLQEREKYIIELEMKLDDKERELCALKVDNEAALKKEGLLREQNMELATIRRERDNSDTERAQHLKQMHDLQEHIREKENQLLALEEQHRVAQKSILYKDEQLREAHSWLARVQEMDALQSTTNQSLQVELRERTEQFNQYWIALHHQYTEMERHHLQVIQQLQLELAEARGQNGEHKDDSCAAHENAGEPSHVQSNINKTVPNGNVTTDGNMVHNSIGSMDCPTKIERASSVPLAPSLLGIGGFLPSAQIAGMHPFLMHPQGVPQPLASPNTVVPQFGHFQTLSTIPVNQHWPNQQFQKEAPDVSQMPKQTKYQPSEADQSTVRSDTSYSNELSPQEQVIHQDHLVTHVNQLQRSGNRSIELTHEQKQLVEPNSTQQVISEEQKIVSKESEDILTPNADYSAIKFGQITAPTCGNIIAASSESQEQVSGQPHSASVVSASATQSHVTSLNSVAELNSNIAGHTNQSRSAGNASGLLPPVIPVPKEPVLLDERFLLACIVRAVPVGSDGRIKISSTLPNRLDKMLAPLHWHDYKRRYGKLEDFVARHPQLFVIEGDSICLQEGAQQIISATAAFAKVAAAAAASSAPHSSLLTSVAVTPVAQSINLKKVTVVDSRPATMSFVNGSASSNLGDSYDKRPQIFKVNDQHQMNVGLNIVQGAPDVSVSNMKNPQEPIGFSSEIQAGQSSLNTSVPNGGKHDRRSHDKGVGNGRPGHGGRQLGRSTGAAYVSRR